MKFVITGVAGFIGSHLASELVRRGFRVFGIDDFSSGSWENLKDVSSFDKFSLVVGDLREVSSRWLDVFRDVDVVFHLAANPEVRHSVRDPIDHFYQNVVASMNVFEAARRFDVEFVVFASSSTVYGEPGVIPTPEDYPFRPISVYGATKVMSEVACRTYARLYGVKCLVLRYANIVGSRLRHGVIYDFIMKLKRNPKVLEILGDGSQRKSYLHVSDAVRASLAALEAMEKKRFIEKVYNVGSRDWVTVREIADIVVREMGLSGVRYVYRPATRDGRGWPGDVKLMLLDVSKIMSETGWEPSMTSREAVEKTARELLMELND